MKAKNVSQYGLELEVMKNFQEIILSKITMSAKFR